MGAELVTIDGSQGEGGGQILRSTLALSLVTRRPVRIENIRAGRPKPGLMRQHLTAVQAAARIGSAEVTGAEIGSKALTFVPQTVTPGRYTFSVGTAGSATLVLQTVLPALMIADGPSQLTLEGGTHNQWAPTFEFLKHAYLPIVSRMGPKVTAALERHGFHPAGGGRFQVEIEPVPRLKPLDLLERGELKNRSASAVVANLPGHIGDREVTTILDRLNWPPTNSLVEVVPAHGPGNVVFATLEYEHVTEVFTGFGRVGASAEHVANEVVRDVRNYLRSETPVGHYLADQILLPQGLCAYQSRLDGEPGRSSFATGPLTRHGITHIEILRKLLDLQITVEDRPDRALHVVTVGP
ncbi:RNA 3'-terminal phosphate cyclase [Planctomyces sp. SH-PL14]|nr:RNA 3'-terminal phosphate cyclase [Planctomyces sp. SH-PL14]AMV20315.1 RNA 3'-terminal phosphate cyclase [Planctomyces sp. SH-PL14]